MTTLEDLRAPAVTTRSLNRRRKPATTVGETQSGDEFVCSGLSGLRIVRYGVLFRVRWPMPGGDWAESEPFILPDDLPVEVLQ